MERMRSLSRALWHNIPHKSQYLLHFVTQLVYGEIANFLGSASLYGGQGLSALCDMCTGIEKPPEGGSDELTNKLIDFMN